MFRILLAALLVSILICWLAWATQFYFLAVIAILAILTLVAPFIDVPTMKKSGKLRYHSLLMLSEKPKDGVIKIHGGTLFDYVFVIDKKMGGNQRRSFIIQQYLEGLLHLLEHTDLEPDTTIRGTSYIINKRTAKRLGFTVVPTDFLQKMILAYNYLNVLVTYSMAKGKLSFPKISKTITFEATLKDIGQKKEFLINLNEKLRSEEIF
ncbi:hypothetical protein K1F50_02185 [Muricauda oceani]|uniref:Uncharacterized protein n=1 Tax=Flagellimonas oceani TaxID=2698672 RepID=A0A6G7J0N5_9FLAO|nr:hypothetical protein [Allomuricauda oceani]MBW8241592.1 hypothetical protein [Allomuricauda oceani]QII44421.1 hypothetical protein GVT53_06945 [Allomuricauda oceani]